MSDRRSLAFAAVTVVWLLGLELLGVEAAMAYLAPALLILLPLLSGRYPGDEALIRVAGRRSRPARPPSQAPPPRRRRAGALLPRGGRLVGASLAGRGPPPARSPNTPIRDEQGATMKSITTKVAAATGVLTMALAGTAGAHITANPGEAPSDSFATLDFSIGHGCEESPTTQVRIKVPPSVPSVTPGVHPLWDVATKEGKKDKVELHGETITRGVSEVTYTAKEPLPADRLDLLTMSVKLPAGEKGESVYFPTIQRCEKGQTRWIQIPAEGESAEELEEPAPAVVLTAAGSEEDAGGRSSAQPAASVQAASVSNDDDGAPTWLAITALAVGALGLLAGVGGLMAGRRRAA